MRVQPKQSITGKVKMPYDLLTNTQICLNYWNLSRYGFARLNLPHFCSKATVEYIIDSVCFVAKHGWKMLPFASCLSCILQL